MKGLLSPAERFGSHPEGNEEPWKGFQPCLRWARMMRPGRGKAVSGMG